MQVVPLLREPPPAISRGIGRVMALYAYLENELQQIVYLLTGVSRKEGRLAIIEPSAKNRLELIRDLLSVHKLKIPVRSGLLKEIENLTSSRNILAHGVWIKSSSHGYSAVSTRGYWNTKEEGRKVTRKIKPGMVPWDTDGLNAFRADLGRVIDEAEALRASVKAALASSPRKST